MLIICRRLGLGRGVVLSRAATSLRSIETKPCDLEICPLKTDAFPVVAVAAYMFYSFLYFTYCPLSQQYPSKLIVQFIHRVDIVIYVNFFSFL